MFSKNLSKSVKIVKNCQNYQNCQKLSKIVKNCQNCKKLSKWPELSKIVKNSEDCQKLSEIVIMLVRSCFLITLIKCLKGHKSLGLLCNVKSKSD